MLVFVGTLIHSTWDEKLEILENRAIGVRDDKIIFVESASKLDSLSKQFEFQDDNVKHLGDREFLIPGFVDTHIHASQFTNAGLGLDLPLLDWLNKYTYPTEARYKDPHFTQTTYQKLVNRVLQNGTTTACYFGTIHEQATLKLCDILGRLGQRALVGKVCMNQNSPPYYQEDTKDSLEGTRSFINAVKSSNNPLVRPIATPRFAISCDQELLEGIAAIAIETNVHIQTHVSENRAEVAEVQRLFPEASSYVDVYQKAGLLTNKTILAHGVYLSLPELETLKKTGTAIAHCPNSNISLCSGLCDTRLLLDYGVKVGLGTDVSGGYSPSMLDAIRQTTQTSKIISLNRGPEYRKVDYKEAFRLATLGGSQALAMDKEIGNFEVGKQFDALRVNVASPQSSFDVFEHDSISDLFQKFIHLGDSRDIMEVYVAGKMVRGSNNSMTVKCA